MNHAMFKRWWVVMLAFAAGCMMSCSDDRSHEGDVGTLEEKGIRAPLPQHVRDEVDGGLPLDQALAFDRRRDVFEDDFHVLGEDPAIMNQASAAHIEVHGTRPVRQFGFQWMRSYARNSSIAFFHQDSLEEQADGTVRLRTIAEMAARPNPEDFQTRHMSRAALGWDLCPEKRFADQIRGGVVPDARCSGTLIDRNLVLTAAHCIRDQFSNELEKPLDEWRVVFNYVVPEPGVLATVTQARDVFRIREVLSMHVGLADFSILELLDEDGNSIDSVDDSHIPVPIWEDNTAPPGVYRTGAVIGVGAGLPQKISLSRSWGWETDQAFLGVHFRADTFKGNSGGGVYDVETGTLVGVVNNQGDVTVQITCPNTRTATTWPDCLLLDPGAQLKAEPMIWVPEFTNLATNPEWRGCLGWAPHEFSDTLADATENLLRTRFNVASATVLSSVFQEGVGVSVHTVRRFACEATAASGSLSAAINQVTNDVLAERDAMENVPACSNPGACPTLRRIPDFSPAAVVHNSELSDSDVRSILQASRLCTGTVVGPRKQLWSDLPRLNMEFGRESTFHGTTLAGHDYFASPRDGVNPVPDDLYRVEVDDWTILYADTFSGGAELGLTNPGTTFDTLLYVMEAVDPDDEDPLLVPSEWESTAGVFDDSRCSSNFFFQSQITQVLEPGKRYILGVSGFLNGQGDYNLHVQAVPSPRNGQLIKPQEATSTFTQDGTFFRVFTAKPFDPVGSEQGCTDGIDSDQPFDPACMYSTQTPLTCQRTDAGDFGFVTVSCPEFRTDKVKFRVEATSLPFGLYNDDPVGQYWDGQVRHDSDGYVCSDDSMEFISIGPFGFSVNTLSSELGSAGQVRADSAETFIASGAGVRTFYAHQFQSGLNWQNLGYTLVVPNDAVNDIWTR